MNRVVLSFEKRFVVANVGLTARDIASLLSSSHEQSITAYSLKSASTLDTIRPSTTQNPLGKGRGSNPVLDSPPVSPKLWFNKFRLEPKT
jgi:hypothetical protein